MILVSWRWVDKESMLLRTERMAYQDDSGILDRLVNQLCSVRRGYCGESGMEEKENWKGTHQVL